MGRSAKWGVAIGMFVAVFSAAGECAADSTDAYGQATTLLLDTFEREIKGWSGRLVGFGKGLFYVLGSLELIVSAARHWYEREGQGFGAFFLNRGLFLGFWATLLSMGPEQMYGVVSWFVDMAGSVSGTRAGADGILREGFEIVKRFVSMGLGANLFSGGQFLLLPSLVMVCVLAYTAAEVIMAQITAWFLAYAGIFLLGFGGSKWTVNYAMGYVNRVVGAGIHLFGVSLVAGVGVRTLKAFADMIPSAADGVEGMFLLSCILLAVAFVFAFVVRTIPSAIASLGGGSAGEGSAAGMLATVTSTAALAFGAAKFGAVTAPRALGKVFDKVPGAGGLVDSMASKVGMQTRAGKERGNAILSSRLEMQQASQKFGGEPGGQSSNGFEQGEEDV